jgi:hypothetical protein
LLDFAGHGANPQPLPRDRTGAGVTPLEQDIQAAFEVLIVQPEIDPQRIALLGHSMGSGAVMRSAIAQPTWYDGVVAVSPTNAEVSPTLPPNLLLQAGSLEAPFVRNARDLLARAGGTAVSPTDFANGTARDFQLINGVEHISILFSPASHTSALAWLNQTWGLAWVSPYRENRMVWYGGHLLAWLVLLTAVAPLLPHATSSEQPVRRRAGKGWAVGTAVVAAILPTLILALFSQLFGVDVSGLGGMLVGGTLALWLFLFGLIWLGLGWHIPTPQPADGLWGVGLWLFWLMAFGALAHWVWLSWWLAPAQWLRWPFLAVACLPWLLGLSLAWQGRSWWGRLGVWAGVSLLLLVGLGVAATAVSGLGFLVLVLPILPLILLLMMWVSGVVTRPWATALAHAAFFAWLLLAVFPRV